MKWTILSKIKILKKIQTFSYLLIYKTLFQSFKGIKTKQTLIEILPCLNETQFPTAYTNQEEFNDTCIF